MFLPGQDGVGEMGEGQCWAVQADGSRCGGPAAPGSFFCSPHRQLGVGTGARVMSIFRAPEAQMPPELVAAMRRFAPEVTFPAPEAEGALTGAPPVPPTSPAAEPGSPLDWLLTLLQQAMAGVMAGDATPLQKANAVARLTGQYLKAYGASELKRENQALHRRVAAAEAQIAALEERLAAPASEVLPAGENVPPGGSPADEANREASLQPSGAPDELWGTLGEGETATRSGDRSSVPSGAGAFAERDRVPP